MAIIVNPESLAPPRGYSNGMVMAGGNLLFIAGQIGWNREGEFASDAFAEQFAQALDNVLDVVREAGGEPASIGNLTIYVTDKQAYIAASKEVGAAYRTRMGSHYPAMALLEVSALLEPRAQVEIQAIAVVPATGEEGA